MDKNNIQNAARIDCQVLGCLTPSYLRVIIGGDRGMLNDSVTQDIPVHLIPIDLRMPNSKFYLVTKYPNSSECLRIEKR